MDYNDIKDLPEGVTVDIRNFQHQQELMHTMINHSNCEITSLKKNIVEINDDKKKMRDDILAAKIQQDRIESQLDLILSSNHLSLPLANILNNSPTIHNTTTCYPGLTFGTHIHD